MTDKRTRIAQMPENDDTEKKAKTEALRATQTRLGAAKTIGSDPAWFCPTAVAIAGAFGELLSNVVDEMA